MITIGIDQSKKSSGIVAIDETGKVVGFCLSTPPIDCDKEELIIFHWHNIKRLIHEVSNGKPFNAVLEGAAFKALGSSNDLLWGIQWYIRTRMLVEFNHHVGILTAATWRKSILKIEEQREYKARYGGKVGLKHGVVNKLPKEVKNAFIDYLDRNRDHINMSKGLKSGSKSNKYMEGLFDLADAWGLAKHRLSLGSNVPKELNDVEKSEKKISALRRKHPNAA